jgi:hypothetical protein
MKEIAIITINAKPVSTLRYLFRYLVILEPQVRSQGRTYTLCSGQKSSGAGFSVVIIFCELSSHQCPIIAYQSSQDSHWALKGYKFCHSLFVSDPANIKIDMPK